MPTRNDDWYVVGVDEELLLLTKTLNDPSSDSVVVNTVSGTKTDVQPLQVHFKFGEFVGIDPVRFSEFRRV